jgi:uncharacterized protein
MVCSDDCGSRRLDPARLRVSRGFVPTASRLAAFVAASLVASCSGASPRAAAGANGRAAVVSVPPPAPSSVRIGGAAAEPQATGGSSTAPPPGYVEMTVGEVTATGDGNAVLLVDAANDVVLPIFVGQNEAMAIDLRQRKQRYQRPLTHDLLDAVMHELGGSLVRVQVDDIKDKTFVGAVFVRAGTRVIELDARPSDAIALALGNRVPIFVARRVVDQAGVRRNDRATPDSSDRSRL